MVGVAIAVVGVAVRYALWRNSAKIASKIANADIYYYWAEPIPAVFVGGHYAPKIQNATTGEVFGLPEELTEQGALWAAEREIKKRGGIPQQGQPV